MTGRLSGKIALVTGAAGGIGAAIADRFAMEGAITIAADLHKPEQGSRLGEIIFQTVDVRDPESVAALFEFISSTYKRLDIVAHCAAKLGGSGPALGVSLSEWRDYIDTNLTGTFLICQAAGRAMEKAGIGGRIITTGSVNSFGAEPGASPYVASKGGVRMLTKALAVDLAPLGITVNMLAPGAITVPRNAGLFAEATTMRQFRTQIPYGTAGLPEDIAHAAVFLAEDAARYVTGTEIVVDGGLLAQILPSDASGP